MEDLMTIVMPILILCGLIVVFMFYTNLRLLSIETKLRQLIDQSCGGRGND